MKTPILRQFTQAVGSFCLRWGSKPLFAVPSCHNRVAYAAAVVAAAEQLLPDVIAIELPGSLNRSPEFTAAVNKIWPRPGAVILAPQGSSGNAMGSIVPVSVADSLIVAMKLPAILARRHPGWRPEIRFIDAENRPQKHGGEVPVRDDWSVMALPDGLMVESARVAGASLKRDPYDDIREQVMAAWLRGIVRSGKSVLAVFGAAHTAGIAATLDAGACFPDDPTALGEGLSNAMKFDALKLNATHQWANGLLDSSPAEAHAFQQYLLQLPASGPLVAFNKAEAVKSIAAAAASRAARELPGGEFSVRSLQQWWKYASQSLTLQGRWTHHSFVRWLDQARDTIGPRFPRILEEEFRRYPGGEDADGFLLFSHGSGNGVALRPKGSRSRGKPPTTRVTLAGGQAVTVPDGAEEIRQRLSDEAEGKDPEPSSWQMVPAASEQRLHRKNYKALRVIGHRKLAGKTVRDPIAVRFEGNSGLGFDIRATLRARSHGESALFVKHPGRRRFVEDTHPGLCDGKCPLLFVFDPDAKVTSTDSGLFFLPTGRAYASHYAYTGQRRLAGGAIRQGTICYFLALLRELAPYDPKAVAKLVSSLPPRRVCTRRPWSDPELGGFSGVNVLLACAIKHADDHIVLAAKRNFTLTPAVQEFARSRRVQIVRVLPAELDSRLFSRLSLEHIVPAPGAYTAPFEWTEQYVTPV